MKKSIREDECTGDIIEFLESRISEDEAAAPEGLGRMETGAQFTGCFDPRRVLMCLASVHRDHPDYEEVWAVDGL